MLEILILTLKIVILLYLSGIGLTYFILPKPLQKYAFWFIPWFGTILIISLSVYLSMLGFSMEKASVYILAVSLGLFLFVAFKHRINLSFKNPFLFVAVATIFIYLFNIYPLLIKVGYPTVISLGNLDPLAYTNTADYLIKHSVFGGNFDDPFSSILAGASDLVNYSYRWGSALIFSYFDVFLKVKTYSIFSILLNIYFALSYSLVFVLADVLYRKKPFLLAVLTFLTFGVNSTLMYMLYSVFFGQVVFVGLFILSIILFWTYTGEKTKTKFLSTNVYEFGLGLILSVLTTLYPEGFYFLLLPILFFYLIKFFKNKLLSNLYPGIRIALFSFFLNPFTFYTTSKWQIRMFNVTTTDQKIGWENIRFAFPHEALGFYNLNYSRDLPITADLILALIFILIIGIGLFSIKRKLVLAGFMLLFGFLYLIFSAFVSNFFVYYRAITYSSFLYAVLFGIGIAVLLKKINSNFLTFIVITILSIASLRSAYRTWFQFYNHYRVVDNTLISLSELNKDKRFDEVIATPDIFYPDGDVWDRLWSIYFLPDKKIISRQNYASVIDKLDKKSLVLYKKEMYSKDPKVKFTNIKWQNDYYILGEVAELNVYEDLNIEK